MTTGQTEYVLESEDEISRLANQHDVIKDEMGGLVFAPINLTTAPLRILDSATADGMRMDVMICVLADVDFPYRHLDP